MADVPLTKDSLLANLSDEWKRVLENTLVKSYWNTILTTLNASDSFLPSPELIFSALNLCPPQKVKVVLLGQDPYIHDYEAMGLSFSVPNGTQIPPSLKNIFKELSLEYQIKYNPKSGDLTKWANDGVLLLNSVLTVEKGKSYSHKGIGWETFTSDIITYLKSKPTVMFLTLGTKARDIVNACKVPPESVVYAGHPSPVNTTGSFIGRNCFRKINESLIKNSILPIRWVL